MISNFHSPTKYPETLFGRQLEQRIIHDFVQSYGTSTVNLLLIKGTYGIGKSSLIQNYCAYGRPTDTLFNSVSYKQFDKSVPFGALIELCSTTIDDLAKHCFVEFKAGLHLLKSTLSPEQLSCFAYYFPRLSVYFNELPESESLPTLEQLAGTIATLLRVIEEVLIEAKKKMIFFLDDIESMDVHTVDFLEAWLAKLIKRSVIWVAAVVEDKRPFDFWSDEANSAVSIQVLDLVGLDHQGLYDLVTAEYSIVPKRDRKFIEIISQLTLGNPLRTKLLLPALINEEIFFPNHETNLWDYNLQYIHKLDKSGKIINHLLDKMEQLSPECMEILSAASAVGNQFNSAIVAVITKNTPAYVANHLQTCLDELLLEGAPQREATGSYRFIHQTILDAAYNNLESEKRKRLHYSLGKTYLSSLAYAARERNIYDIVDQFNKCTSYFNSDSERLELVEMNLQAGKKAKREDDFDHAQAYFTAAIRLIEANRQSWNSDLVFDVYIESGEVTLLKNDYVSSVMFFESAMKYASTNLQKAKVHYNFLVMQNGVGDLYEVWNGGIKVLDYLNEELPSSLSKLYCLRQYFNFHFLIPKKKLPVLETWKQLESPQDEFLLLTWMELLPAAINKNPELRIYILSKSLEILIKNGISPSGFYAITGVGSILGVEIGHIRLGWDYYCYAEKLVANSGITKYKARVQFAMYGEYSHFILPILDSIPQLEQVFDLATSAGDHATSAACTERLVQAMLVGNYGIECLQMKIRNFYPYLRKIDNLEGIQALKSIELFCFMMTTGLEENKTKLADHLHELGTVIDHRIKDNWDIYHALALLVYNQKAELASYTSHLRNPVFKQPAAIDLIWVVCQLFIAAEQVSEGVNKNTNLKLIKTTHKKLADLAAINPSNFGFPHLLAKGLMTQFRGDLEEALIIYRAALAATSKFEFNHFNGLMNEYIYRLHLKNNMQDDSISVLEQALDSYTSWGAKYKVKQLKIGNKQHKEEQFTSVFN